MKILGAAFGDEVDDGAGAASEFGGVAGGFHLYFGDGVYVGVDDAVTVRAVIVIFGAIYKEIAGLRANAVDVLLVQGELRVEDVEGGGDYARGEAQELYVFAAVERELADLFAVDDAADAARGGLYLFR